MKQILLIIPLLFAGGCNILGFAADKVTPMGETKEATYILADEPTIVIVENWRNPSGTAIDAEQIQRDIYENLSAHNIAPQIDPTAIIDLRSNRPDFGKLSIAEIGHLVGAKQVIYVNVTDTSLMSAMGSDELHGKATARVKVIDVATGEASWPTDSAQGYPISISTPMSEAHDQEQETEQRERLLAAAADRICHLFYKAPVDE
jgi:hypothetical protein